MGARFFFPSPPSSRWGRCPYAIDSEMQERNYQLLRYDGFEAQVTTDLIQRARSGDGEAFRELTEPYHRELRVHCYRMLGSLQDAEDTLQDLLVAAWQGLAGFEGRASIRTWLYRIA